MKKLIFVALLALLGCGKDPMSKASTDNPEITVSTLFTHDGCTVYRFSDYGNPHYFVRCPQEQMTINTRTESCGKGCARRRSDTIETK